MGITLTFGWQSAKSVDGHLDNGGIIIERAAFNNEDFWIILHPLAKNITDFILYFSVP